MIFNNRSVRDRNGKLLDMYWKFVGEMDWVGETFTASQIVVTHADDSMVFIKED